MDIPALVRQELGDEEILAGVSIGDEDVVCLTPTRTIVYRSEGLISDERVDTYPHEADRVELSEGRRKSKFSIDYFDETRTLSVPTGNTRDVLTLLLEGILRTNEVIDADESLVGAFRFSELTLVVAGKRLVRHIGGTVWDDEYESYRYEELTGIAFEESSVATELVVEIEGRPQRIKLPRKDARLVEETVKTAVFEFYDVASFEELRRVVTVADDDDGLDAGNTEESGGETAADELTLEGDIDPLVTDDGDGDLIEAGTTGTATTDEEPTTSEAVATESVPAADIGVESDDEPARQSREATPGEANTLSDVDRLEALLDDADVASEAELRSLSEEVEDLSTAVKRQNKLLKKQHDAIKRLVEELRGS